MNTPNPLLPQGSLEAQQYQKRSATKIVVSSILAIHGVVLGGLLFLGCNPEPAEKDKVAKSGGFEALHPTTTDTNRLSSDPFGDLTGTNVDIAIPLPGTSTNDPFGGIAGGHTNVAISPNPFGNSTGLDTTLPPVSTNPPLITPTATSTVAAPLTTYTVLPKDNFSSIAKKHKTTVKAISEANPNVDSRQLKVGDKLNLPANVTPKAPPVPEGGPNSGGTHGIESNYTVKSGDTLTKIARGHKVTVKDLQRANAIKGSNIKVGQKLVIPAPTSSSAGR